MEVNENGGDCQLEVVEMVVEGICGKRKRLGITKTGPPDHEAPQPYTRA